MLFRCFPYALVLGLAFFRFSDPFSSVSRGFLFLRERERERESMGLFCLLGSRLVKSVKFSRSLICNPTFSISFLVPSLRPCLCNPPPAPTHRHRHHHHHHRLTKTLTQALMTSCCQYRDSNMLVLERGWCVHILRFQDFLK